MPIPASRDLYRAEKAASLTETAYLRIREKILRGQFRLGAVLSRRALAAEFGMSFLPISEALQRLENEGLVESRPRVGTRVKVPTREEIRGHYYVREALEVQCARTFAEKATPARRQELRKMAARLDAMFARCADEPVTSGYLFSVHSYHLRFHMRIAEGTRCRQLCEAMERNQVLVFNWLYDLSAGRRSLPAQFHEELAREVAGTDPEAAEQAMRRHVCYGVEANLERIRAYLERDRWRAVRSIRGREQALQD